MNPPFRSLVHRRRAGKIAHLRQPIRDQINLMLQDNVPYADIIAKLGDAGKGLNKDNLSRWRKADYQDWLAEQNWRQANAGRPEPPPEVKHICLLLNELDQKKLEAMLARRPAKLLWFLNLAARLPRVAAPKRPDVQNETK